MSFECRVVQAVILKRVIDAIKDLVEDTNLDCSPAGLGLQSMDSSHVALVSLFMRNDAFDSYHTDRSMEVGINMKSMHKILSLAGNNDRLSLKYNEADKKEPVLHFIYEVNGTDHVSHFAMKTLDVDEERLGIPDTEYECVVTLSSSEFKNICSKCTAIGSTVKITVTNESAEFAVEGDMGTGKIILKQAKLPSGAPVDFADRKEPAQKVSGKKSKLALQSESKADAEAAAISAALSDPKSVFIRTQTKGDEGASIVQCFALRYLTMFCGATPLSDWVVLKMSPDVPLVVEYKIEVEGGDMGFLRYYLAPKINEEEEESRQARHEMEVDSNDNKSTA